MSNYNADYYRKNKERIKARRQAWEKAHPENVRAMRKRATVKHRAKINAKARRLRKKPSWRLRQCWTNLLKRCSDPRHRSYPYYGGRGIQNFLSFEWLKFLWDRDGASNMTKPSLDRIDAGGHYTLENCRFIEQSENSARKRGIKYRKRTEQKSCVPAIS